MTIAIRPLTPDFAGEVSGVDLTRPLTEAEVAALEAGMDRFAVLVYHGQDITDEQQKSFSLNFGGLEQTAGGNVTRPKTAGWTRYGGVSNLAPTISLLARDDRRRLFNLGNRLWHSDSSFGRCRRSIRYCRDGSSSIRGAIPNLPICGQLMTRGSRPRKRKCDLVCEHSLIYSRGPRVYRIARRGTRLFKPVRQSLVRTIRSTGRRSLYLPLISVRSSAGPRRKRVLSSVT